MNKQFFIKFETITGSEYTGIITVNMNETIKTIEDKITSRYMIHMQSDLIIIDCETFTEYERKYCMNQFLELDI